MFTFLEEKTTLDAELVLATNLITVLTAGLVSGILCRRWNVAPLVGYLLAGALIGPNLLGIVSLPESPAIAGQAMAEPGGPAQFQLEQIAQAGVLLLLFSLGIELSLEGLWRLRQAFLVGGLTQTILVLAPTAALAWLFGASWGPALLIGVAVANSSTVLVFKALEEWGLVTTAAGKRTLALLLFGDIVLIPFLLVVPFLTGEGGLPGVNDLALLAGQFALLVLGVPVARHVVGHLALERLLRLRSTEVIVLFTVVVLGGICLAVYHIGLPPAIGALAAGFVFGGSRWSKQIDAVTLPFRETAAAVFFVALGTVLRPSLLLAYPLAVACSFLAIVLGKMVAGAVALRISGLSWPSSLGLGTALGQMSEFSFLLLFAGMQAGALPRGVYEFLLVVAVLTLVATPQLIRLGLSWVGGTGEEPPAGIIRTTLPEEIDEAVVIGAGPIGRGVAARLETLGMDVCLVDLSPVNLYAFAQQGFRTVAGDAQQPDVLDHAGIQRAKLVVVTVPDDAVALEIVRQVRAMNTKAPVLVRCRYQLNQESLRRAGATAVVAEEVEAASALLSLLERMEKLEGGFPPQPSTS